MPSAGAPQPAQDSAELHLLSLLFISPRHCHLFSNCDKKINAPKDRKQQVKGTLSPTSAHLSSKQLVWEVPHQLLSKCVKTRRYTKHYVCEQVTGHAAM